MSTLRVLADIHGQTDKYYNLVKDQEYSLQLGDFGFRENYNILDKLDPEKHKVLFGNHCDYSLFGKRPHFLGDFGPLEFAGLEGAFYVRGERSIDYRYRTLGLDLFWEEELTFRQQYEAFEAYCLAKPNFMFSHGCPSSIIPLIVGNNKFDGQWLTPSRTSELLEEMFRANKPHLWIFGHYHKFFRERINGCDFVCLPELGYIDLDVDALNEGF